MAWGSVLANLNYDITIFDFLEFRFVTTGNDACISTGRIYKPTVNKFSVAAIGTRGGTANSRKLYAVAMKFNKSNNTLTLEETMEKPELHLIGIWGYKNI